VVRYHQEHPENDKSGQTRAMTLGQKDVPNRLSFVTHLPGNKTATSGTSYTPAESISDRIISYRVAFTVPEQEAHATATFEVLTGYMPAGMMFYTYQDNVLAPLSDGPGEQEKPVIAATPDGAYAMGISDLHHFRHVCGTCRRN